MKTDLLLMRIIMGFVFIVEEMLYSFYEFLIDDEYRVQVLIGGSIAFFPLNEWTTKIAS
jgi:hypothetical protein